MKPLRLEELLPAAAWEALRPAYREALLAHKAARRVAVGERVTLVFEDRETLRWQVQEMARVEQLRGAEALQAELDVYNELLPGAGELSATLFIEITDLAEIRPELDRMIGIDEHVALVLGEGPGALRVDARFDPKQMEEERISAVQYIRFGLGDEARRRLADPAVRAALAIDHPAYEAAAALAPETRASLLADLEGGVGPLLDLAGAPRGDAATGRVLEEGPLVRVTEPAHPEAPGHRILEAREGASFLEAPPELLAALQAALRRHGKALKERHGSCRLRAELDTPLRWHLLAGSPRA